MDVLQHPGWFRPPPRLDQPGCFSKERRVLMDVDERAVMTQPDILSIPIGCRIAHAQIDQREGQSR